MASAEQQHRQRGSNSQGQQDSPSYRLTPLRVCAAGLHGFSKDVFHRKLPSLVTRALSSPQLPFSEPLCIGDPADFGVINRSLTGRGHRKYVRATLRNGFSTRLYAHSGLLSLFLRMKVFACCSSQILHLQGLPEPNPLPVNLLPIRGILSTANSLFTFSTHSTH